MPKQIRRVMGEAISFEKLCGVVENGAGQSKSWGIAQESIVVVFSIGISYLSCFVSGHDFSHAVLRRTILEGFSPCFGDAFRQGPKPKFLGGRLPHG